MSVPAARQLARHVLDLSIDRLPAHVIEEAKLKTLDLLGVALAARGDPAGEAVALCARQRGGAGRAILLAGGPRADAPMAALANGALAHCLELDDDHHETLIHPGAVVIPAALAAAEEVGATGAAFLEAVVAGYEVIGRVGRAPRPGILHRRGFHPTGLVGVFGAAAAAGRLYGLDEDTLVSAFGIAGSLAGSIFEFASDGSLTKRLHPGWAAHNGIMAVRLAGAGMTGPATVFEGPSGFLRAFAGEGEFDVGRLLEGPGVDWEICRTAYKPYACCSYIHAAIDAALAAAREGPVPPEAIEVLTVRVHPEQHYVIALPEERKRRPRTVVDAQFSVYFAVAAALVAGPRERMETYLDMFTPEQLDDPRLLSLAGRVRCLPGTGADGGFPRLYPAEAELVTRDGRTFAKAVPTHRGDPALPATRFSAGDVVERFRGLTAGVLPPEEQERVIGLVDGLDRLVELAVLTTSRPCGPW